MQITAQVLRANPQGLGETMACAVLDTVAMALRTDPTTLPFLIILWTTLTVGLIMVMVVVLMH